MSKSKKKFQSESTNVRGMPYKYNGPQPTGRKGWSIYLKRELIKLFYNRRRHNALRLLPRILDKNIIHIVDIGAAEGIDKRWQVLKNNLRISLFEPEQESYLKLQKLYCNDMRVDCFSCALSETSQELTLNIVEWPRASSIFQPNQSFVNNTFLRDHFKVVAKVRVPTKSLIDVLPGADISLIKADVEGYELPILRGAGSLLDKCIGLELEVNFNPHIRLGVPLFGEVEIFCRKKGFTLITLRTPKYMHYLLPSWKFESKGFMAATDALFFRLPHTVIDMIIKKEWPKYKLAAAASIYLVYGNFELAYELMRESVQLNLITENHVLYRDVMECVRIYSGYDQFIPYAKMKSIILRIRGRSENDALDF